MNRPVRAAALTAGAVVGLLAALAAYASVAPSGTEPSPAPGPAPTIAAVPA